MRRPRRASECHPSLNLEASRLSMHLYLGIHPRVLYLATSSHDQRLGRPDRTLVFRAAPRNSVQAIVEFRPTNEVNLSNAILLTNRVVKGCLGLISIDNGKCSAIVFAVKCSYKTCFRDLLGSRNIRYRGRKHSPVNLKARICG